MMQTDFTWKYSQHPQQQIEQNQIPSGGLLPPAVPWAAPPSASFGASELNPLYPGSEPTFHDDVTGLFECDSLLFSDIGGHEWTGQGRGPSPSAGGIGGNDLLGLVPEASGLPGLNITAPILAPIATTHIPSTAKPLTTATQQPTTVGLPPLSTSLKSGMIVQPLGGTEEGATRSTTGFLGIQECANTSILDPKVTAEASGSGSGDASIDGFTIPGEITNAAPGIKTLREEASPSPVKSPLDIALGFALHGEGEGSSDNDDEIGAPKSEFGQGQAHFRGSFSLRPSSAAAHYEPSMAPLSSSGHSAGRSTQPSTSRGQASAASALGKRPAGDFIEGGKQQRRGGGGARMLTHQMTMKKMMSNTEVYDELWGLAIRLGAHPRQHQLVLQLDYKDVLLRTALILIT